MQALSQEDKTPLQVNSMKFINENKHFIVSTNKGFTVCETATTDVRVKAQIKGGVAHCDSYKNTNIFFFVGTGAHIDFPSTKLCIWNDKSKNVVGSIQFTPTMKIVDLVVQGDWILVIFQESCRLFHFDIGFS